MSSSHLQFYVSVILNGFDKTFFHGFLLKETAVMFFRGTFASNSNQFLAAWENSCAVLDIIQTQSFYYFCDFYISEVETTNSTDTSFRF